MKLSLSLFLSATSYFAVAVRFSRNKIPISQPEIAQNAQNAQNALLETDQTAPLCLPKQICLIHSNKNESFYGGRSILCSYFH